MNELLCHHEVQKRGRLGRSARNLFSQVNARRWMRAEPGRFCLFGLAQTRFLIWMRQRGAQSITGRVIGEVLLAPLNGIQCTAKVTLRKASTAHGWGNIDLRSRKPLLKLPTPCELRRLLWHCTFSWRVFSFPHTLESTRSVLAWPQSSFGEHFIT